MKEGYSNKKAEILQVIYEKERVSTTELSEIFNVSTETIRRYLTSLEKEAKIKRLHGGAEKLTSYSSEKAITERSIKNEREKIKIAKEAAKLIHNGEKILIDEGTTTLNLIHFLEGKKDLTIITSSFPLAMEIMNLININKITGKLIFLGGIVQCDNKRTVGREVIEGIKNHYVDKVFISCEGLTLEHGITAFDEMKAEVSREYLKQGKEVIVLADFSKIGIRNYYKIDEIFKVSKVITNKDVPKQWEQEIDKWEIDWIVAI